MKKVFESDSDMSAVCKHHVQGDVCKEGMQGMV